MRERILSVQALRFFAAAMVVYHHAVMQALSVSHAAGALAPFDLAAVGAAGVDVFFVISGLVIALTGPLAEPRPSAASFFWRRWSRVVPVFWVMSIPAFFLVGQGFVWARAIPTIFFWPILGNVPEPPYIGVGWTLCFEMLFYSAVALTLIGGHIRRNLMTATVAFSLLIVAAERSDSMSLRFLINPILIEFFAGIGLALALPRLRKVAPAFGAILALLGLALFARLSIVGVGGMEGALAMRPTLTGAGALHRLVICGPPAVLLVTGALICEPWFHRLPILERVAKWGDASYSIYLAHSVALLALFQLWPFLPRPSPEFVIVFCIALGLASGFALHRWVERPLLKATRSLRLRVGSRQAIQADNGPVGERAGV